MDFITKRKYKRKSIIYKTILVFLTILFSSLFFIGLFKNNNYLIFSFLIFIFLNINITLHISNKYANKRIKYLKDIKLYRQYNFLHLIIFNIRKNDFVIANKYVSGVQKNEKLVDFIHPFLINELLHSNQMFMNKLGEDNLKNFLDEHNKNNIFNE
jgi:hypothetical protein